MIKSLQAMSDEQEIDKIRGSRFIAIAGPVESVAAAQEVAAERWRAHPSARHCCWAYRGLGEQDFRWEDDGEPSGSAGRPLLQLIDGEGLSQVGVWVIRYFGGTKLGVGGLARAYRAAAQAAIAASEPLTLRERVRLELGLAYHFEGRLEQLIKEHKGSVEGKVYTDEVSLTVSFLSGDAGPFITEAQERCAGRLRLSPSAPYLG